MRKLSAAVIFAAYLFVIHGIFAQPPDIPKPGTGMIMGGVVDSAARIPIPYANVLIYPLAGDSIITGAASDTLGNFSLNDVPFGQYRLRITFMGYEPWQKDSIELKAQQMNIGFLNLGQISLTAKAFDIQAVEVESAKPTIENLIDKRVVNVDKMPVAAGGTVIDVLKMTPSITVDLNNAISIQGRSGVTILMDGKPMLGDSRLLEQMPAAMIDKIEVITTPSARYDPEGDAGIINIIQKKSELPSYNGRVNLGGNTNDGLHGGYIFNYKKNNWNFFADYSLYRSVFESTSNSTRLTWGDAGTDFRRSQGKSDGSYTGQNAKLGVDCDLNPRHSLTASIEGNYNRSNNNGFTGEFQGESDSSAQLEYDNRNSATYKQTQICEGLFYKWKPGKEGHELTSDLYNNNYTSNDLTDNAFYYYPSDRQNFSVRKTHTNNHYLTWRTDYVNPSKTLGKVEAGFHFTFRDRRQEYSAKTADSLAQWQLDTNLSNDFGYQEQIWATYSSYTRKLKSLDFKLGLRVEATSTRSKLYNTEEINRDSYAGIFPSAFVGYNFNPQQSLRFNYSRRIRRPSLYYINPFLNKISPTDWYQGNPQLKPIYVHVMELSANWKSLNSKAYMTSSQDNYRSVTTIVDDTISLRKSVNLASARTWGVDLSGYFPITKWLQISPYFNLYYLIYKGSYLTETFDYDGFFWSLNLSINTTIWWDMSLSFWGNYSPGYKTHIEKRKETIWTGIALSRQFFDRRLRINLNLNDIFKKNIYEDESYGSNYISTSYRKYNGSRSVSLSISWTINDFRQKYQKDMDDGRDAKPKD